MSDGQVGAPEGVPITPLPEPKSFEIWWHNDDLPVANYSGVTGSHLDGDLLFLMWPNGSERLINLRFARQVNIWNDVP